MRHLEYGYWDISSVVDLELYCYIAAAAACQSVVNHDASLTIVGSLNEKLLYLTWISSCPPLMIQLNTIVIIGFSLDERNS